MKINEVFKFPLKYDDYGQSILDKNNSKVLDIRGWGHIQYLDEEPEKIQDDIGEYICQLINEDVKQND